MSDPRAAAAAFAAYWSDKGYEKGQCQPFWLSLLREVFGVSHPEQYITFEEQVHLDHASFIDGYIPATRVMIEQKGSHRLLSDGIRQSDGSVLSPLEQAKRYINELPVDQHPRYVITCNFREFWVYDMNKPHGDPEKILLKDLAKDYYRLQFLVDKGNVHLQRELELSVAAGDIVGQLYDAFAKQYATVSDISDEEKARSLNILCVRLVFCLYAENTALFGRHGTFHNYLSQFTTNRLRPALVALFRILDTPEDRRDRFLAADEPLLAAFPYVNGGLFAEENITIPPLTEEIRTLLLRHASEGFNWSDISPTIFGAVFESTLNPATRRAGGMHYTSRANIHKVIDPLFLDALRSKRDAILALPEGKRRDREVRAFQQEIAALTFFDPACGSGNFLTETFLSLRELENTLLRALASDGQIALGGDFSPIQVSLAQFYGIEINDFAVAVARTALWIAEHQMIRQTEEIVGATLAFLPLKSYTNIVEGNALTLDWQTVVPRERLSYIIGNPPFVGYSLQNEHQKREMETVCVDRQNRKIKAAGKIDYVAGWYFKAAQLMQGTPIRAALVATNSITQGEQVASIWKPLMEGGVHIDFAYRTFRWDSESNNKAHVHCVIIGFSTTPNPAPKTIYLSDKQRQEGVENINAYLLDEPNIFIESRRTPLCDVPEICKGFQTTDFGFLTLSEEERQELLMREPRAANWIRPFSQGEEFINSIPRYCLWLVDITPHELRSMPEVLKRVSACRKARMDAPEGGDAYKLRDTPHLFRPCKQYKDIPYIAVPLTSSEQRKYVPIALVNDGTIPGNGLFCIFNASLYHFGVLTSNIHNAWMRVVGGRLEMRYRYSKDIVYNNFPWPAPTDEQRLRIAQTAQAILSARANYAACSLADLYDENTMPLVLRNAHRDNDRAVAAAYGWSKGMAEYGEEGACVSALLRKYVSMIERREQ